MPRRISYKSGASTIQTATNKYLGRSVTGDFTDNKGLMEGEYLDLSKEALREDEEAIDDRRRRLARGEKLERDIVDSTPPIVIIWD